MTKTHEIRMPFSQALLLRDKLNIVLNNTSSNGQIHLSIKNLAGSKYNV